MIRVRKGLLSVSRSLEKRTSTQPAQVCIKPLPVAVGTILASKTLDWKLLTHCKMSKKDIFSQNCQCSIFSKNRNLQRCTAFTCGSWEKVRFLALSSAAPSLPAVRSGEMQRIGLMKQPGNFWAAGQSIVGRNLENQVAPLLETLY